MGALQRPHHRIQQRPGLRPKQQDHLYHHPVEQVWNLVVHPPCHIISPNLCHITRTLTMFQCTYGQSLYVFSIVLLGYWNRVTPSTKGSPSRSYRLNFISPALWASSTSRHSNHISVYRLHLFIHCLRIIFSSGICMPKFGHQGKGEGPSCRITTWAFQCLYIKCSRSLPGV